ncbi:MAG: GYF domain-containing protein [Verrucomicrobiales bacterium]|nr:GYF domain-containing protein [Verrucomicrobiales bacterium]
MEWFYEKEGKQEGPVDAAELIRLLEAGAVSSKCLVWREGMESWLPMEEADVLRGAQGEELVVCAHSGEVKPKTDMVPYGERWVLPEHREEFVQHLMEGAAVPGSQGAADYDPRIGHYLNQAWLMMVADFWPIIGVSAAIIVGYSLASQMPLGGLLATPLFAGLGYYMMLKLRGKNAKFEDSLAGFQRNFWQLILMGLVSGLLMMLVFVPGVMIAVGGMVAMEAVSELAGISIIALGTVVAMIPFVYLNAAWMFASLLCVDKKMDFWPAMSLSMKTVNRHWFSCLIFGLVLGLLNVAGMFLLCVGVFFTMPWTLLALVCFYEDVFGKQRVRELETGGQ